jgi:transcriptional regulator with XRE-family HTH domain
MKKAKKPSVDHGVRGVVKQDGQIGARIRAIRMDQKISQSELGDQLGVSFQQVQKYEKGINRVSAVRLNEIATILKTTHEQLTGFNGPQIDGIEFDLEAYKLAKAFTKLPDHIKPRLRSLINSIIETEE